MQKAIKILLVNLIVLTVLSSCGTYHKAMKSDNVEEKIQVANTLYDNEKYYKAGMLYEQLFPLVIGKPIAQEIHLKYAYCHYNQGYFELAAKYFRSYYNSYQTDQREHAMYMQVKSRFMMTPQYNLDQSNTMSAIASIQNFLNQHPQSEYKEEANELIDELQRRLERKAFENAALYAKIGSYKSAIIAFDNFMEDFPDSERVEEAQYLQVDTQYKLAKISVDKLIIERMEQVIQYAEHYTRKNPSGEHLKDVQNLQANAKKDIEQHKKYLERNSN